MKAHSVRIRVAIVATHPIQYQAPLWRKLASDSRFEVLVLYGSDLSIRGYRDREFGIKIQWDQPLTSGYRHHFLSRDPSLQNLSFLRPSGAGIGPLIDQFQPDVILLNAYHGLIWLRAILAARIRRIPLIMRHEASDDAKHRSKLRERMRDVVLRLTYGQIQRFGAIGINARKHLIRLGVQHGRIGCAPYCVDSEGLEEQYQNWHPKREELRNGLGVRSGDLVLIFSGKLIAKKQPLLLLEAIKLIPEKKQSQLHLIVLGEGVQRPEIERDGRKILGHRLHLVGFVNQTEIGKWYAASDCLVLPSRSGAGETWGLVVNEALQFGLPVIVSKGVGCAPDLVVSDTGLILEETTAKALSRAIMTIWGRGEAVSEACRRHVRHYSIHSAQVGLAELIINAARRSV
jgi:glycosyltransferase involved in cell wall biosynthesis